jgi:hypothetical protein
MTPTQMVETIWEGNVKEFSRAFELICIVDQIQDYAVNHHRPFVMNHLEAWHARHQKTLEPIKKAVREINNLTANMDVAHEDSDMSGFDSEDSNGNPYDYEELAELFQVGPDKPAEWLRLKEQSKNARQEIANETRKRNRSLLELAQAPKSASEPPETRPRGRPRKAGAAKDEAPKRGRGRPPKMANKIITQAPKSEKEPPEIRTRGRPRKAGVAKKEAPKRGRGRPPKIANKIIIQA